jgi:hypothetical protein
VDLYHQYFDGEPVRFEFQPRPEEHRLVVTTHQPEDPEAADGARQALMNAAAEVVHGARCVLDHLAYAIAKFQSPEASEDDLFGVYFPIITNEDTWNKRARQGRLKLFTEETREQMREMQVFVPGGQGSWTREGLVRLNNLDRTDRHRQLNVALVKSAEVVYDV